jgi:hypothetical protein
MAETSLRHANPPPSLPGATAEQSQLRAFEWRLENA